VEIADYFLVFGEERVISVCKANKRRIPHMLSGKIGQLLGEFAI
jgi:hypothetical protein